MPVANVPADQILNERTSYDQYLWLLIDGYYYRWDNRVEYMYTIKAVPVDGQGLPPKPPVNPIDSPFPFDEESYLNEHFVRTVNGNPPTDGDVSFDFVDSVARNAAQLAQEKANSAVRTVNNSEPDENGNVNVSGGNVTDGAIGSKLSKWFAGGVRGKKVVFVGDSTTEWATGLTRALLNYYTRSGRELDGVGVLNYGINGGLLKDWLTNTGRYGKDGTVAANADLYVLCYGINDIRLGATSENDLVALLGQAVDSLTANGATVLLRMPNSFTTSDTSGYGFISPETPAAAQAYSSLLRNAYIRTAAAKSVALLDTQGLVFGVTSTTDASSPYMLNQIHPNDFGNNALAAALVKVIGENPSATPTVFSMRGPVSTGVLGTRVLLAGGRVSFGFARYQPTATAGTLIVTVSKIPVGGGPSVVLGTATYTGGTGSGNTLAPQAAIADWSQLAAGDAVQVSVTTATAKVSNLDVYFNVDETPRVRQYPLSFTRNGLVSSLDGGVIAPATVPLPEASERNVRGLRALSFSRLGANRITQYSGDISQAVWQRLNATVAASVLTATGAGASTWQTFAVTAGEQVTFSWKATSTAATPRYAVYDQTNGVFITAPTVWPAADANGWRSAVVTIPAGCTTARAYPVANTGAQGVSGETFTVTAVMVNSGTAMAQYAPTTAIGTSLVYNTGALPADCTIITAVRVTAQAGGTAVVAAGINADGNPTLQASSGRFGYPVISTRGTVPQAANGAWQIAVLRATGGNVYATVNDQAQSVAFAKAVNASSIRLNLLNSTDTTGAFQTWDGEVIGEYYPYLLTEGEAAARMREIFRTLLAAGETVTTDISQQRLI